MAELLQTVDLSRSVPARWQLVGFSALKSDGVNPYRVPGPSTQVQFESTGPRYMQFSLQLFSPTQNVSANVRLDGHNLGPFNFPAGKFVTLYPGGFVGAGQHTLTVEARCAQSCEVRQYYAGAKFFSTETASSAVGFDVQRWWLNAPDTALRVQGFSGIQFDGHNFYRTLGSTQPATITLPPGVRPTNLHYMTQTNHGAYKLVWTAGGRPLSVRNDLNAEWAGAGQSANQNVPLVSRQIPQQLQVRAECQGGGAACLPVRFFWTDLTGVSSHVGLSSLSAPKQALSAGLCLLLCVLAAWWLRPWAGREHQG